MRADRSRAVEAPLSYGWGDPDNEKDARRRPSLPTIMGELRGEELGVVELLLVGEDVRVPAGLHRPLEGV